MPPTPTTTGGVPRRSSPPSATQCRRSPRCPREMRTYRSPTRSSTPAPPPCSSAPCAARCRTAASPDVPSRATRSWKPTTSRAAPARPSWRLQRPARAPASSSVTPVSAKPLSTSRATSAARISTRRARKSADCATTLSALSPTSPSRHRTTKSASTTQVRSRLSQRAPRQPATILNSNACAVARSAHSAPSMRPTTRTIRVGSKTSILPSSPRPCFRTTILSSSTSDVPQSLISPLRPGTDERSAASTPARPSPLH
mmetsp:Transcript_5701/g.17195  ORF Transcript_5701/g.17195 Transcript_5701/m.17195 type:complete len:257 (+) Transcript_5701:2978-3748(+)